VQRQGDDVDEDAGPGRGAHQLVGVRRTRGGAARDDSDASDARLADLRDRDYGGRDCSEPDYSPSTTEYDVDVDVDDDVDLPGGALTGGYCTRKWWC
jgi:hypothetical protein